MIENNLRDADDVQIIDEIEGNDGSDVEKYPTYPAAYDADNIISVGATDTTGNIASFSNYGKGVDIAAPGKGIYSTSPNIATRIHRQSKDMVF